MVNSFKAFQVQEKDGSFQHELITLPITDLPKEGLLIQVTYSSLNYKDALSAAGNKGVSRKFPHVPGIDAVGSVLEPVSDKFKKGDKVIVTGYDLGMNTWGGFGEMIRVPEEWVLPLPKDLTEKEAMCYGTAGLTAGLSVQQIVKAGIKPESGPIVISGASGGVGSMAVAILNKLGYKVTAISSKNDEGYFKDTLGANEVIDRDSFVTNYDSKPLAKTNFAAGIDCVGGKILSGMIKSVKYGGLVTCCGMVSSVALNTSIFPFILRGLSLIGIDSVELPLTTKKETWDKLAKEWKPANITDFCRIIEKEDLSTELNKLLEGKAKGRSILQH